MALVLENRPIINLPVMETFLTIQGEGAFTGHAAWFIRLAGCNVGCVWCDVKDSWDASRHPVRVVDELADEAAASGAPIVVVTGGEPVLHDLSAITKALKGRGLRTHIETSGVEEISGEWDWICLSPKKFRAPVESSFLKADELKVVVYHPSDLQWAMDLASRVRPDCALLLQPEWSKAAESTNLIVDHIRRHPNWRVSLQTHKYMNIP